MVFSTPFFLFTYFPIVLILHTATPLRYRNAMLLVVNLIFYGWKRPAYILIMFASIGIDYVHGLLVEKAKAQDDDRRARRYVVQSVVFNLALLGFFKYWDFIARSLAGLGLGFMPVLGLELPVGISFYTFQTMSYTIDVYRGKVPAERNIVDFGAFVVLFPQLIAGPIVQYKTVTAELCRRVNTAEDFALGARRFTLGLAKKVLLANSIGALWDAQLAAQAAGKLTVAGGWLGILAFGFQIYFDFSGYSDMAIGLGQIFGFRFLENFDHPYLSASVTEFWRRWHMSLTGWFREYLYIPLGGSRCGAAKTLRNILIVWLCTGFWHGASWNFILWGLYFAAWLVLEKYVLRQALKKTPGWIKHLYTLAVVFVGWGIFAMEDLAVCGGYFSVCFGGGRLWSAADGYILRSYGLTFLILILASTTLGQRLWRRLPRQAERVLTPVLMGLGLVLCTAYLVDGSYNPFLYFRF